MYVLISSLSKKPVTRDLKKMYLKINLKFIFLSMRDIILKWSCEKYIFFVYVQWLQYREWWNSDAKNQRNFDVIIISYFK